MPRAAVRAQRLAQPVERAQHIDELGLRNLAGDETGGQLAHVFDVVPRAVVHVDIDVAVAHAPFAARDCDQFRLDVPVARLGPARAECKPSPWRW